MQEGIKYVPFGVLEGGERKKRSRHRNKRANVDEEVVSDPSSQ
jgi:hypothetical protein